MTKAIFIDPTAKTATAIQFDGTFEEAKRLLGYGTVEIISLCRADGYFGLDGCVQFEEGEYLMVNENGRLDGTAQRDGGFGLVGSLVIGKGLIVGKMFDRKGETYLKPVDTDTLLIVLEDHMRFAEKRVA